MSETLRSTVVNELGEPLESAHVYYKNTKQLATTTDEEGVFSLPKIGSDTLILSYQGVKTSVPVVDVQNYIVLETQVSLSNVEITNKKSSSAINIFLGACLALATVATITTERNNAIERKL